MSIKLSILNIMMPVSKLISRIHFPFSRKKIRSEHIESIKPHLIPGAVLVTITQGELANIFIPGEFSHAAICSTDEGYVVEAKTTGIQKTSIIDFMMSKDRIVLLYPTFTQEYGMKFAALKCEEIIGSPYDFYFDPANKAFYCSELIQFGYSNFDIWIKRMSAFGINTVLPQDFIDSAKSKFPKWTIVWDSKKV